MSPLTGGSPRDAVTQFQDHLNGVLNRVLTHHRLTFLIGPKNATKATLCFGGKEPVAVKLNPIWYLYLGQTLLAEPVLGGTFALRTIAYAYRVQRAPSLSEEAVVRFEYESDRQTDYCRHHVQFHRDYHDKIDGFSPSKSSHSNRLGDDRKRAPFRDN